MREAFTGRGEVFVDRGEMIFQRLVKISFHAFEQLGFLERPITR
jgi:hypothetical protein